MACASLAFGVDYILQPLDARLKDVIPPAVARAAGWKAVGKGAQWPVHYPAF